MGMIDGNDDAAFAQDLTDILVKIREELTELNETITAILREVKKEKERG